MVVNLKRIAGSDALPALTAFPGQAGIRQTRHGSLPCPANGVRRVRGSAAPRGFRKRLQSVKAVAEHLPAVGRPYGYAASSVGPDLKVWAVPQDGEAQLSRLGLSIPPNSQNRSRTGLKGCSTHGKKQIRWSCQLMDDFRERCAMWTVTLPDSDYLLLSGTCQWRNFQRRVIDLLIRHLKANGDEAVVIAAVEVGSKRFARTGRPDPHIHLITSGWGRRHPEGGWLLSPDRMDQLVAKACQYAQLPSTSRPSCSRVEPVRHSVASYMSKYLTKDAPVDPESMPDEWQNLIPHQWWSQSASCKAMVEGVMCKLPPAFASFLVRKAILLENLSLGKGGVRTVGWKKRKCHDIPIEVFRFVFRTPECLHQALELFALWVINEEVLDAEGLVMSG